MKMSLRMTGAMLAASACVLSGCTQLNAALNERTETHEFLRIFDVKTKADVDAIGAALADGMELNLGSPSIERPLVFDEVPEKPGRFSVSDKLANTNLSNLIQLSGGSTVQFKMLDCNNSPWKGFAVRGKQSGDYFGRVQVCLFPYKGGYQVSMYGYLSLKKGGINELVRGPVFMALGDPLQWIEKAMLDTVRTVRKDLNAEVTLVEANPAIKGTPWLMDPGMDIPEQKKKE